MRIILGLTGPTGSGKSTAAKLALQRNIQVIDCDLIARKAVESKNKGLLALTNAFGTGILNTDGTLNRKKLASIAFASTDNTERLNKTLLPFIKELVLREISSDKVLLDAPTLFESKMEIFCNSTLAVLADGEIRFKRITERDGLSETEAETRMNAGKGDDFYRERANYIVFNNGDIVDFTTQINAVFDKVFGGNDL